MTTQYTTILKLALPVQGELSGTWGDVVNDNITSMVEEAVAGRKVIDTWTANSHTLTSADGTTSESRAAILTLTDTGTALTGAGTVVCPAASKIYIVENSTAQVITIKTSGGTGIAVPVGKNMVVFCDGTNVEEGISNIASLSIGGDGATVTGIKDEDNMASNSATKLATQQSIKAYVDSQVGANNELSEVLTNGNTTGGTDIAVGTGDDITFADSSKAIFGAGSDLQIYHDGTDSIINESTAGNLLVQGATIKLQTANGAKDYLVASPSAEVTLYHNNAAKLATTSTGIDVTGNATFADNGKAIFGGGSDLEIYHDGSDSYISDQGTGTLKIQGDSQVRLESTAGERYFVGTNNGAARLYYDDTEKLATTSTGIDVTGTATMDGLTVDGTASVSAANPKIQLFETDTTDLNTQIQNQAGDFRVSRLDDDAGSLTIHFSIDHSTGNVSIPSGDLDVTGTATMDGLTVDGAVAINTNNVVHTALTPSYSFIESDVTGENTQFLQASGTLRIRTVDDSLANPVERLRIDHGTGDISFYEDTGTTPKMVWDSSAESLGIGCTPSRNLDIQGTGDTLVSIVSPAANQAALFFGDTDSDSVGRVAYDNSDNSMRFNTNGSEAMRIDSSGNVGIGTSSPNASARLHIGKSGGSPELWLERTDGYLPTKIIANTLGNGQGFKINVAGADALAIDSSQRVGIGTDSPSKKLVISDGGAMGVEISPDDSGNGYSRIINYDRTTNQYEPLRIEGEILQFSTGTTATEKARLDASGNLLVGKTATAISSDGVEARNNGLLVATRDNNKAAILNRRSSDGDILEFNKSGVAVGSIGARGSTNLYIVFRTEANGDGCGLTGSAASDGAIIPSDGDGDAVDNHIDLGASGTRFDDIYATNGTIQTSDRNEKQDIEELSDAEQRVAVAAKGLLRKFRWINSVETKGDDARIHFGIIAQDLQDAFTAEGLDAGRYAMFISSTWTDEETGEERTRLGVRYSELLAFIIAAI